MNERPDLWPPAPGPQNAENASIGVCPTCKRKLLTQTSALCNWCGAKIDNPDYQQQAARSRAERDQQERAELEAAIQEETQHGILGRLKRLGKQNKGGTKPNPLA